MLAGEIAASEATETNLLQVTCQVAERLLRQEDRAEKCLRMPHFRPSRRDSWRENIDLATHSK